MDRNSRKDAARGSSGAPPSEAWLFAQAIQGKPIPRIISPETKARAERERLEQLAQFSSSHAEELRRLQIAEAEARRKREILEWAAQISTECESKLRALQRKEVAEREAWQRAEQYAARLLEDQSETRQSQPTDRPEPTYLSDIIEWNADQPRQPKGTPEGGQWAPKGGGGGGATIGKSPAFLDAITQRNRTIAELTGIVTPGMIRATRIAAELQSAVKLPGEVARAAAAGLGTGAKAVVNGFATAIKDTATLGLSPGQLDLIGVTKEDRARGYDTAVAISTGSGQVLIAVGTGGITSALSKGGSVARAANGALLAYDAAGNAVGVVQGVYDASQNGVSIANGAQVAAGALGLVANATALKGLKASQPAKTPSGSPPSRAPATSSTAPFRVGKHSEMPTPRPGQHSHHGVMSAWMKKVYPSYDPKKAPAILMPDKNHRATTGIFNTWRAETARKMGGVFDWNTVTEADMRGLSQKMFDAANVPSEIRRQYWAEFDRMKAALQRSPGRPATEGIFMSENLGVMTADEMKQLYGDFYHRSPRVTLDRSKVPTRFWPLLPYADFWGIVDDLTREILVEEAPAIVQHNLKQVVAAFDSALDEWLAGPEANDPNPSDEYVAYSAMRMAADFV